MRGSGRRKFLILPHKEVALNIDSARRTMITTAGLGGMRKLRRRFGISPKAGFLGTGPQGEQFAWKDSERFARTILNGFESYFAEFQNITLAAKSRFENADWQGMHQASTQRIDLYKIKTKQDLPNT